MQIFNYEEFIGHQKKYFQNTCFTT